MTTTAVQLSERVSRRDGGSFRDPSGYVFHRDGAVYRALTERAYEDVVALTASGLLQRLQQERLIVPTRYVDSPDLAAALACENPGYAHFLHHDRISPITYPYEWTASMVADAALHTLRLQQRLVTEGWSLKDATAYNIQFAGGRPVFIDTTSIEQPARLDVWYALGQFTQLFLFPLLLFRYHGWDFRSYYLGRLGGREIADVSRSLSFLERWSPRALLDVTLPLMFHGSDTVAPKAEVAMRRRSANPQAQLMNLRRLERKIRRLIAGYRPRGPWAEYTGTCNYSNDAEDAKKRLVGEMLDVARPGVVLDVGCNTGDYSFLAAAKGASVIAVDADHDAVDILYRRLREHPASIAPMVMNLSEPSPAIGFMNGERQSFTDRVAPDCVVALALLHHLSVSGNLSLPAVSALFHSLTRRFLILEHVPPTDSMFQKLVRLRTDRHEDLTLDACRAAFSVAFTVVREAAVPGSQRTLLLLEKRPSDGRTDR